MKQAQFLHRILNSDEKADLKTNQPRNTVAVMSTIELGPNWRKTLPEKPRIPNSIPETRSAYAQQSLEANRYSQMSGTTDYKSRLACECQFRLDCIQGLRCLESQQANFPPAKDLRGGHKRGLQIFTSAIVYTPDLPVSVDFLALFVTLLRKARYPENSGKCNSAMGKALGAYEGVGFGQIVFEGIGFETT
ncbi:unnamed protein product, partial [Protopolystoma xenopodis]